LELADNIDLFRYSVISIQNNGFLAFSGFCRPHVNDWHTSCLKEVREEKVMKLRKKMERGFTLIELLAAAAVVSVISLLLPAVQ